MDLCFEHWEGFTVSSECFIDLVILQLGPIFYIFFCLNSFFHLVIDYYQENRHNLHLSSPLYLLTTTSNFGVISGLLVLNYLEWFVKDSQEVNQILTPIVLLITHIFVFFHYQLLHWRGESTSYKLDIFWFLSSISFIFKVYDLYLNKGYHEEEEEEEGEEVIVVSWIICEAFLTFSFIINFFYVENTFGLFKVPHRVSQFSSSKLPTTTTSSSSQPSEEEENISLFSKVSFWWINSLIRLGFKRTLEMNDLFPISSIYRTNYVNNLFSIQWENEKKKCSSKNNNDQNSMRIYEESEEEEELLSHKSSNEINNDNNNNNCISIELSIFFQNITSILHFHNCCPNFQKPFLLKTLLICFGRDLFLKGGLFKFIHDCLAFLSPLLLRELIYYIEEEQQSSETNANSSSNQWKGFIISGSLFILALFQSIFLHQYFYLCCISTMRVRGALVSEIYKKSLLLSNSSRSETSMGEIVNLMSVDVQRLTEMIPNINMIWSAPFQIILSIYLLFITIGPSVLSGVVMMVLVLPVSGLISNKIKKLQIELMKVKDERSKLLSELLNAIKLLKLYSWESSFERIISRLRKKEVKYLFSSGMWKAIGTFCWISSPQIVALSSFATYVLLGNTLTASKAFVSLSLFKLLEFPMSTISNVLQNLFQCSLSIQRIQSFLLNNQISLDDDDDDDDERVKTTISHFSNKEEEEEIQEQKSYKQQSRKEKKIEINISNGSFSWFETNTTTNTNTTQDIEEEGAKIESGINLTTFSTNLENKIICLKKINCLERGNKLVAVVGRVASGKSSFLSAILGEMVKVEGNISINGTISYVPQQPWIFNDSLQKNILFGKEYEYELYDRVVSGCGLIPDFDVLPVGDKTQIGEKGINLSGGQKQRVSLARAIYQQSDIYLFDDPLSSVDTHVAQHIFNSVISHNGILSNKLRICVINQLHFLPLFDEILVIQDSTISLRGSFQDLIEQSSTFSRLLKDISEKQKQRNLNDLKIEELSLGEVMRTTTSSTTILSSSSSPSSSKENQKTNEMNSKIKEWTEKEKKSGLNMIEPEIPKTGSVNFILFLKYFQVGGIYLTILILFSFFFGQVFALGGNFWLTYWSKESDENEQKVNDNIGMYLGVYSCFILINCLCISISYILLSMLSLRVSKQLHSEMLSSILRVPMSFFDITPMGRILNRFIKDIYELDVNVPEGFGWWFLCFFEVVSIIVVVSIATPWFMLIIPPLSIVYFFTQRYYISSSRQLNRLVSISISPIYSHFTESLYGVISIRAYKKQREFILHNQELLDKYQISHYSRASVNRWLALRLEFIGNLVVFFSALFSVIQRSSIEPEIVGLSVSYALIITQYMAWIVRLTSNLETGIISIERIQEYSELEEEEEKGFISQLSESNHDWTHSGSISFVNYSTRYRPETPLVLSDLSFEINSSEKIGICGRTASGKSSLALALFRIIEPVQGTILIDGVDIKKIGLWDLRRHLTIIPQDPVLFSGSLRFNLDPFEAYSDDDIWKALEKSHLKETVKKLDNKLMFQVSEGGSNFSVGQRQLICLARAIMRKTKILILDEATASVDIETDKLIQDSIRSEFSGCTILTIAHRLNTIRDSTRIIVLNNGRVAEFDTPNNLLQNPNSIFYSMNSERELF